ncbi:MAG: hypothetical protein L0229_10545 [Blastocatellia bacterium]|nr:hypothetical protein [Blastocatellia bacterium]
MKSLTAIFPLIALLFTSAQAPVPVEKEPRHHLKFENRYTRVFDVTLPPGDVTLFHTHSKDYVFVSIGDADLKGQVMGADPVPLILKSGEVRFTEAPITHRVENTGAAPFHTIAIEILRPSGVEASLEKIPGHTVVLDNERIRVERLILEPGQSTGLHKHTMPGLGVAVSGGKVVIESVGQKPQTLELKAGDFRWRDGATAHSIKNIGKSRFEAVDVEWK